MTQKQTVMQTAARSLSVRDNDAEEVTSKKCEESGHF